MIMALIAAGFVFIGFVLAVVQKYKTTMNKGWPTLAFACAGASLAISYIAASDWWRAAGFGLLALVGFIASIQMIKRKVQGDALTGGAKLITGNVWLDGALFAAIIAGLCGVLQLVMRG